jgi:LPS-assembly protein
LRVGALALNGLAAVAAAEGQSLADLRVRSEAAETVVEAWVGPQEPIVDETGPPPPEGGPAVAPGGLVGQGVTFAEEIRLVLPETTASRAASVIVGDPFVSEVRVRPQTDGSVLVIFVRQAVHYEVRRIDGVLQVRVRPLAPGERRPTRREVIGGRGDEREITVDAEVLGYERQGSVMHARGGVAVTRPGSTLTADEVRIFRETSQGEARGDVVLRTDGVTARGEYAELDLTDETGFIDSGEVDLPRTGYIITGGRLEKGFGQTYHVHDGIVTTCRCGGLEPPSWSFASRKLDVDLHGTGRARHVIFRLRDVPVLYFPYAVFPVNRARQSGFLMPRIGQSVGGKNARGFEYEQPYFWAISKSADATASFRVETEARVGGVAEYRYALARESRGTVAGTYFNESLRTKDVEFEDPTIVERPPEDRWGLYSRMRHSGPGAVRGYLDTMLVSDDLFFREIESVAFKPAEHQGSRTRFYTASRLGGLRVWDRMSVMGEGTLYQDLNVQLKNEDETVFQRAPVVEMQARRGVLGDRLALALVGQGVNYQRQTGFDGLRLDVHPQARVPFRLGRFLFGQLEGSLRGTTYHQTDTEQVVRVCVGGPSDGAPCSLETSCGIGGTCQARRPGVCVGGDRDGLACATNQRCRATSPTGTDGVCRADPAAGSLDGDQARGAVRLGWRVGSEIARVYPFERWGFSRLKHTIEPVVSYGWIPRIGGQDDLPLYDGIDRINRRSLLSYGFESRLKARYGATTAADAAEATYDDEVDELYDDEADEPDGDEMDALYDGGADDDVDELYVDEPHDDEADDPGDDRVGELHDDPREPDVDRAGEPDDDEVGDLADPTARGLLEPARNDPPDDAARARGEDPPPAGVVAQAPRVRELARLSVLQAYDTERKIANDEHFSDVDFALRLTPHSLLALQYGATYNFSENNLKGASVTLQMVEPWRADNEQLAALQSPSRLAFSYRFVDAGVGADPASPGIEELNGLLYVRLGRFLGLLVHTRFNLLEKLAFDRGIAGRFISRCSCWMVEVGVENRETPEEQTSVRAQVTLFGIGSLGRGARGRALATPGLRRADAWP